MLKTAFYILAVITVLSAMYVVVCKNLARAVFVFFATLFCLAGIYVFAFADFVAITQIMVYVGGIVVLMLFGIMLSNRQLLNFLVDEKNETRFFSLNKTGAFLLSATVFIGLIRMITMANVANLKWLKDAVSSQQYYTGFENSPQIIGVQTMTNYLLPFEAASVYLLAVLIGAAYLARKKKIG
ncbi:NADH-quinone oxidoreductase subunit J family protein [Solitalea koreensis]|uniref:NADH-quinone oxidoreductase subunit J n=1 Tax=Solitalea koreensis TaxID=543615 RepID=A0A521D0T7_9SPHI|nr:NADH-quinone oxidoreductase subunit J [Solitalea koreensis]SMO65306.1 NADH-quinone oxidoreductase subunit J [Solitalea koreensis]